MKQRYLALDLLRGLTIFGMVFSAIIPFGPLPAWMYHVQNPPPTHELNIAVPGMSWVDLVFPIFIFCMGAAIPLAGRKKLSQIFGRFIMLWAFSYLYVFMMFTDVGSVWGDVLTLAGFCALFPLYMVLKKDINRKKQLIIRSIGIIAVLMVCAVGHFAFGEVISVQRRGVIIFLLAFLYLFGAGIWNLTHNKPWLRAAIIGVILAFTVVSQRLGWPTTTYANSDIRWWFNLEYIYFLLLLLPATYIGELLKKRISEGKTDLQAGMSRGRKWISYCASLVFLGIIVALLHYSRMGVIITESAASIGVAICSVVVPVILSIFLPQYKKYFYLMAVLLVAGFAFEPFSMGIKKVPCTIAYCFVTCAISLMLLFILENLCHISQRNAFVWIFSGAGQNPLMSYIAHSSLVVPIMSITHLSAIYRACYPYDKPWIATLSAAILVLLTMAAVACFSKKKLFWRA